MIFFKSSSSRTLLSSPSPSLNLLASPPSPDSQLVNSVYLHNSKAKKTVVIFYRLDTKFVHYTTVVF